MAKSTLEHLRFGGPPGPVGDSDRALKQIDPEYEDRGAGALLGPSGRGNTTPLVISVVYGFAVFRWM